MKHIRSGPQRVQFEISQDEKNLLAHLLRLYPLVPANHQRLSQGRQIPDREENQQLLEDSLNAQRQENRKHVEAMLNEQGRFVECPAGSRVSFSRSEIEWLLQVCNDVRVGSWLALGSPAQHPEILPGVDPQTAQHIVIMEVAAFFEMQLLSAASSGRQSGHA
jgi:hypothetical protein